MGYITFTETYGAFETKINNFTFGANLGPLLMSRCMNSRTISALSTGRIREIEGVVESDREDLKKDFKHFMHTLSPANIIRRTVHNLSTGPDFKGDLVNMAMSIGAGLLSRKVMVGKTRNPIKNIIGTLLQAGVTNLVAKNADTLKSAGIGLLGKLLSRKKTTGQEESAYQDVQ